MDETFQRAKNHTFFFQSHKKNFMPYKLFNINLFQHPNTALVLELLPLELDAYSDFLAIVKRCWLFATKHFASADQQRKFLFQAKQANLAKSRTYRFFFFFILRDFKGNLILCLHYLSNK